jgi:hypothetical protein
MPVYGSNYPRLAALKEKMDPEGFFCHSMFPRPHAPDEWDQLPPLTQERVRRDHEIKDRLKAKGKAKDVNARAEIVAREETKDGSEAREELNVGI